AKPGAAARAEVPYHLLDVLEPSQEYSLAQYVATAWSTVEDVLERGRQPLFVGGTPLYLKALLRGIFEGPPADWELRRRMQAEAGPAIVAGRGGGGAPRGGRATQAGRHPPAHPGAGGLREDRHADQRTATAIRTAAL